jgi:hypothetical protein
MACNGLKADTCGGAGRITLFEKDCSPTPGCYAGYGHYRTFTNAQSVHDCSVQCQADSQCVSFQFGRDSPTQPYCNLFLYAIPVVIASQHDSYCDSYNFYAATCPL